MGVKNPWDDVPHVWKDEKAYFNWLRSSIRRVWTRHPIKIAYKQSRRYKAPVGRNNKDVWVSDCEICGKQSRETEIDHLEGGYGFKDWQSFTEWSKMILWVTFDDLRELCKDCHAAVTLSQKLVIPLEDAFIEKQVIEICKSKKDRAFIKENNEIPKSNAAQRREQVREILRRNK
jgi:hypothetical protein